MKNIIAYSIVSTAVICGFAQGQANFIPASASPAAQSATNAQVAAAYGTPQYGGENFGGWGGLQNYTLGPEGYLNQVKSNGVMGIDAANASNNAFWGP